MSLVLINLFSCSSYEQFKNYSKNLEIPSEVFKADYVQSWQAALQVMKKYDLSFQDQESGTIKTRWKDNTLELNFSDSFGGKDSVKTAKFKLIMTLVKGYRGGKEVTKISIYKRQMVAQDFLQGEKIVHSDNILEKTILYRIKRQIIIDNKLKKIEQQKMKEAEQSF